MTFPVDFKVICKDCNEVYAEWAKEDLELHERQLAKFIRNVEIGSREAREAKQYGSMATFEALRLRLIEAHNPDHDAAPALSWARLMKEIQREEEAEEIKPANITLLEAPKTEAT